jgi:hypothetical protein
MDISRNMFIDYEDDNQLEDEDVGCVGCVGEDVDVIADGLDKFTSALIERDSCHFEMEH